MICDDLKVVNKESLATRISRTTTAFGAFICLCVQVYLISTTQNKYRGRALEEVLVCMSAKTCINVRNVVLS